jgi:hypothetical protein
MFQRIKDALFFESEFSKWEYFSDLRSLLEGSRAARAYGQDDSFYNGVEIYLLGEICNHLRPSFIESGKVWGLSSRETAIKFLCAVYDEYMVKLNLDQPPEAFFCPLSSLTPIYRNNGSLFLSEKWVVWLKEYHENQRKYYEDQRTFTPIIDKAREDSKKLINEYILQLKDTPLPTQLLILWQNLQIYKHTTERNLSNISGLTLIDTITWLEVLRRYSVVNIGGTALVEPSYWLAILDFLEGDALKLRNKLDAQALKNKIS